ncbi:MAG: C39 family peptidase, partial [Anaerolineaceae bacterium]
YGGQVPPYSYGVHADPVARLLQKYGLPADARKAMSLDDLRSEIASGHPVIVWIIYGVTSGYALDYTASDGESLVVAPNEHTVIVTGYDETSITVLDGAWVYQRSIDQFLSSWSVLGNMAVVYQPED